MYSLLWLTFESSVGLPQEVHTRERCWSSSVRVCLNINGVGLWHITAHCHWHIHKYYMGSKRLQPQRRRNGEKAALSVDWCGVWRGERGTDGVQGVGRLLWCFFFRLFSPSERREDDVSSMPAVPSVLRARHAGGRLRQLLVQPLSAVPFFYVFDENKRWISSAMRGGSVIWKKSHTNKTITMLCFALTFYIWYKPVHIKTMHFLPLWHPVLAPPTQPSYSVLHVSAPIWTKGMRVGEDFPRWDDSQ